MPWPSSTTSITTETIVNSGAIEMSIPPPRIAGVDAIAASAGVASSANVTIHELQYRKLCCTATLATSSATASTAGSSQARSAARHPWWGRAGEVGAGEANGAGEVGEAGGVDLEGRTGGAGAAGRWACGFAAGAGCGGCAVSSAAAGPKNSRTMLARL